jgi:hypothetical protein
VGYLIKILSLAAVGLLVIASLGPGNWVPRTGLGFEAEHFLAFFVVTLIVCLAWPRPFVVGGALMVMSALLEGLEVLTPDRSSNLQAALWGAAGALAAALFVALFMRVRSPPKSD